MVRGWGLEAGFRVRVIHPAARADDVKPSRAQQAARYYDAIRDADRRRSHWHQMWVEQGGK